MLWQFRHGNGKRIYDMVVQRSKLPPPLEFSRPCIHFHLLRKCRHSEACRKARSHRSMNRRDERAFLEWVQQLNQQPPIVPDCMPPVAGARGKQQRRNDRDRRNNGDRRNHNMQGHPNGRGYVAGHPLVHRDCPHDR